MTFTGFDERDGAALYDTKEAAIQRARMLKQWNEPDAEIWVQRKHFPTWLAHLIRDTWFRRLAYTRLE